MSSSTDEVFPPQPRGITCWYSCAEMGEDGEMCRGGVDVKLHGASPEGLMQPGSEWEYTCLECGAVNGKRNVETGTGW